jgi:2-haloalkanoic acid dehalogenase type II
MGDTSRQSGMNTRRYDAVLFDLLTAVLDSWTLWAQVAGDPQAARRWREQYLQLTYGAGRYVPYESLVAQAAVTQGLDPALAQRLTQAWGQLQPWPEAPRVLTAIAATRPIGTVTNCSDELGRQAAELVGVPFEVVVTAQSAGAYKPDPEPYRRALDALASPADRVLFVAGSPYDIVGAGRIGMDVWWHNRIGMSVDPVRRPVAEHLSLDPLPAFVRCGASGSGVLPPGAVVVG